MDFNSIGSIIFEEKIYDSAELRKQINLVKSQVAKMPCDPNTVVGIYMKSSPYAITAMMALLELGIPYLPISLSFPKDRIDYIIKDSGMKYVITSKDLQASLSDIPVITIEQIQSQDCSGLIEAKRVDDEVAYILYTSGSTGKPKAVEVRQTGLENFILGMAEVIDFSAGKVIASFTTYTFDIFLLESITSLYLGLTVVLANEEEQKNPKKIEQLILNNKVQMLQMTPSRMQMLYLYDNELKCLTGVSEIMIGGEQFPSSLLKILQSKTKAHIYNMYGPTETTIWSTVAELTEEQEIHIGQPIRNTQIYLLDGINEVADGETGEICIGGDGLAKGYKNNDAATEKAFVFLNGKRIYRTSDLGRYTRDHKLLCLGRTDNQIKLRGYRIELDEIDNNILDIPGIVSSVTCLFQNENVSKLITFFMANKLVSETEIQNYLSEKLPDYMIPQQIIKVEKFIYTTSGKKDKNAMLDYYFNMLNKHSESLLDMSKELSEEQKKVIRFFENSLEMDEGSINLETVLASINVDSVKYISIIVGLEEEFDKEFDDEFLLFENVKTVGDIVNLISSENTSTS